MAGKAAILMAAAMRAEAAGTANPKYRLGVRMHMPMSAVPESWWSRIVAAK
jgi:hypothetical protein